MSTILSNLFKAIYSFIRNINWINLILFVLFIPGCHCVVRSLARYSFHINGDIKSANISVPAWKLDLEKVCNSPTLMSTVEPFYYDVLDYLEEDEIGELCRKYGIDRTNHFFINIFSLLTWLSVSGESEKEMAILTNEVVNGKVYKPYSAIEYYLNNNYYPRILESLGNGDYYTAKALLDKFFRIYELGVDFPEFSKTMNKAYLLNTVLQDRWEMSANRYVSESIIGRIIDDSMFKNKLSFKSDVSSFQYISDYYSGLDAIRSKDYYKAYDCFLEAMSDSQYEDVKELCSLMIIRCAVWKYDVSHNMADYTSAVKDIKDYSANIHQLYFKVDLDGYITRLKKLRAEYSPL